MKLGIERWQGAAGVLGVVVAAGCGGAGGEPATPAAAGANGSAASGEAGAAGSGAAATASAQPAAASKKRATLRFELGGDDFPAPLVDVIVSGHPATMIVDTGATHQVIATWVAEQVGQTAASSDVGLDHAGKRLTLGRLVGGTIAVSGWGAIDASNAVVTKVPAPLQKRGIGGVLSPQALASDEAAVVLDFRRGQMTAAPLADALRALESEAGSAIEGEVRSCGPGGGALLFVRASVAGMEVDAQLDTGATETTVRATSETGARLWAKAKAEATAIAASGVFTVPVVEGARVKVGALEVDTNVGLVTKDARPVCPNDTLLGMDVLRRCVIVIGAKVVAARCSAPPA